MRFRGFPPLTTMVTGAWSSFEARGVGSGLDGGGSGGGGEGSTAVEREGERREGLD